MAGAASSGNWHLSDLDITSCTNFVGPAQNDGISGHGYDFRNLSPDCNRTYIQLESCRTPHRLATRIGPLVSTPQRWHYFATPRFGEIFHDRVDRITAFTGRAVDAHGLPIGYPPIHIHHLHLQVDHKSSFNIHWFETHGDFGLDGVADATATRGYTRQLPAGYCMTVEPTDRMRMLWTVINDVRPEGHGPELRVYIEVSFDLALPSAPCTPVGLLWFNNPPGTYNRQHGQTDPYERYDVLPHPSAVWWSGHMPFSGQLLPQSWWLHTHRARYYGLLLFRRHATAVVQQAGGCARLGITERSPPHDSHIVHDRLLGWDWHKLESTFERLAAADGLVCRDRATSPSGVVINGSWYDRAGATQSPEILILLPPPSFSRLFSLPSFSHLPVV